MDKYWKGDKHGDMKWSTASNWLDGVVPASEDNVFFDGKEINSDCIVDPLARTELLGGVVFKNGVTITITLQKSLYFVSQMPEYLNRCVFSMDGTNCNVTITGPYNFSVNAFDMCNTIGLPSNFYLKDGVTLLTNGYILLKNIGSIIPDSGTTMNCTGFCSFYGTLGKINTAYSLIVDQFVTSTYGTFIAPNALGTFICGGYFQSPNVFVHSGGKMITNGTMVLILKPGDLLNYFYDLEIPEFSFVTVAKQIVVSGTKTGSIISDQVPDGILTIEHNLTIFEGPDMDSELHAYEPSASSILLKDTRLVDSGTVI